jgi:hypothetical protein
MLSPLETGEIPTSPFVHKLCWCSINLTVIDILAVFTGKKQSSQANIQYYCQALSWKTRRYSRQCYFLNLFLTSAFL